MGKAWFYDRLAGKEFELDEVEAAVWPLELTVKVVIELPSGRTVTLSLDRFVLLWLN